MLTSAKTFNVNKVDDRTSKKLLGAPGRTTRSKGSLLAGAKPSTTAPVGPVGQVHDRTGGLQTERPTPPGPSGSGSLTAPVGLGNGFLVRFPRCGVRWSVSRPESAGLMELRFPITCAARTPNRHLPGHHSEDLLREARCSGSEVWDGLTKDETG